MKYYTIESHAEKEAPFGISWKVKLFDGHTLLEEYDHIFYNEIAGYCKCLEDMGFVIMSAPELPDEKIIQTVYNAIQNGELDIFGIYNNDKKAIEDAKKLWAEWLKIDIEAETVEEKKKSWYKHIGCWPDNTPTLY